MLEGFRSWLSEPFHDEMDVVDWLAFVGLILVIIIFWRLILAHVLQED